MQWLAEHSIANMYGPHFLVLYGGVIILTLGMCWWMVQRRAKSLSEGNEAPAAVVAAEVTRAALRIKLGGACVIVGLGGYKLLAALVKGRHNVGFLILMCIVALCVLSAMRASPARTHG
jgi:hypothetical protein